MKFYATESPQKHIHAQPKIFGKITLPAAFTLLMLQQPLGERKSKRKRRKRRRRKREAADLGQPETTGPLHFQLGQCSVSKAGQEICTEVGLMSAHVSNTHRELTELQGRCSISSTHTQHSVGGWGWGQCSQNEFRAASSIQERGFCSGAAASGHHLLFLVTQRIQLLMGRVDCLEGLSQSAPKGSSFYLFTRFQKVSCIEVFWFVISVIS